MRARAVGKKMAALLQQRLFLQGAHVTNVVFSVALLLLFYCRHLLQIKMLLLQLLLFHGDLMFVAFKGAHI